MPRKKTIDSLIMSPGKIRGVLKRKGLTELKDPQGDEIPLDYIRDHLLVKDRFVRNIAELWLGIYTQIAHLKKLLLDGGPEMYEYLERNDDVRSDSKGGFTEYDFGKNIKVKVSYDLRYSFDDNLMKRASSHFDNWLKKQGESSITKAFRKAFKKQSGDYDIKALNRLNQLQEDDEDFLKAMELKNEAQTSTPTKLRTQLYIRDEEGEFVGIPLAITDITKEDSERIDEDHLEKLISHTPNT